MIRSVVIPEREIVEDGIFYYFPNVAFRNRLKKEGIDLKREFSVEFDRFHYNYIVMQEVLDGADGAPE